MDQVLIVLNNHLVDIIIGIFALTVIIRSFYKPTHRYIRNLVGLLISFLTIFVLKTVDLFNVVEVYLEGFFASINFKGIITTIVNLVGYSDLPEYKIDSIYYLSIITIFGLVIYLLVNFFMALGHNRKVKLARKEGNHKYNSPIGSFLFATILLVIGIFTTTILFATLPFDIDVISKSYVLTIANNLLNAGYAFVKPYIVMFDGFEHYTDVVVRIIG